MITQAELVQYLRDVLHYVDGTVELLEFQHTTLNTKKRQAYNRMKQQTEMDIQQGVVLVDTREFGPGVSQRDGVIVTATRYIPLKQTNWYEHHGQWAIYQGNDLSELTMDHGVPHERNTLPPEDRRSDTYPILCTAQAQYDWLARLKQAKQAEGSGTDA